MQAINASPMILPEVELWKSHQIHVQKMTA